MTDSLDLIVGHGAEVSGLDLDQLEVIIERGQQTFIEVGRALMEIRDRRLYRETHATFEAYCGERWGWTRQHAYRHIDAAQVAGALSSTDDKPGSVREARAMLANLEPEEREQVRKGTATPATLARLSSPPRKPATVQPPQPRRNTTSDAYMVEVVRDKLTRLREEYGTLAYWRPVWDAIAAVNKEPGR